jgi:hypothetical protein
MRFVFYVSNNSFTHSIEFDLDAANSIMDDTEALFLSACLQLKSLT